MTHGNHVGKAAHDARRVADRFALCGARTVCGRKSQNSASQFKHSRLEAKSRARARFKKQRGKRFAVKGMGVSLSVFHNVFSLIYKRVDFRNAHIGYIQQMFHFFSVSFLSSSRRTDCRGTQAHVGRSPDRLFFSPQPPRTARQDWKDSRFPRLLRKAFPRSYSCCRKRC